jgi:hypothetical protein
MKGASKSVALSSACSAKVAIFGTQAACSLPSPISGSKMPVNALMWEADVEEGRRASGAAWWGRMRS